MKKTLALILAFVLVIGATVAGTMAYLTDYDNVTNTFTVGNVDIILDEADVDEMGNPDGDTRVQENDYKLIPGHSYTKDPTVHVVKNSETSYVRMLVTFDNYSNLDEVLKKYSLDQIFVGFNHDLWKYAGETTDEAKNTKTYEFRYVDPVTPDKDKNLDLMPLFTGVKIPAEMTKEELAKIATTHMTITAQAIQADGFNGDVNAAWDAFN